MKKCSRYLDALDGLTEKDSGSWQDVIIHAGKCPDCSSDMKMRSTMLEMLAETSEPAYPGNLHDSVMEAVKADSGAVTDSAGEGFFSRIFDLALQPLEIAIPVACLVMFAFLLQIDREPEPGKNYRLTRTASVPDKSAVSPADSGNGQELEKVTVAEVKDFLKQLEEFRRMHPDTRSPAMPMVPEGQVVDDRSLWRNP